MSILETLPVPLNTFEVDIPANTYYDFELKSNSAYPLKGVTYPVDYGNIPGYTGEDGHELDLFVGSEIQGLAGYLIVYRGESTPDEHKFYIGLTSEQLDNILAELKPVLIKHETLSDMKTLLDMVEQFKDKT